MPVNAPKEKIKIIINILKKCEECGNTLKTIRDTLYYCDSSPTICSMSTKAITD